MISSDRMAAVDRNAAALGVARKQLMESSGNAVAHEVRARADPGDRVALVCGRGNNGGDAMVAARFLDDHEVAVHLLGRPETIATDIARENWTALRRAGYETRVVADSRAFDLDAPDLVVDAMLGTGVTGALREPAATAARRINDAAATVVSVDVPSGVDADTGEAAGVRVEADAVVTFHDLKPGLTDRDDVTVAGIGIPEAASLFVGPGDLGRLGRDPRSHKGDNGEVLVVGGGPYTGAPTLTARAALRAGADLVRVACPASVADEIQGYDENLIVTPVPGETVGPAHVEDLLDRAADQDVVVLGPGLGDGEATLSAAESFLAAYDGRAVVDADALRVVPGVDTDAELLCTPHQGELRGMGGPAADDWRDRADAVAEFAGEVGATLLVKGARDVVTDGDRTRVNRTGNPGMTVGGTGDVLAGVCGALVADGALDAVAAGAVAAFAVGRAGDAAAAARGNGLVATDITERLPEALRDDDA
ncbi:MAG: NAD(P)H-hydrate dehydratase [Halolamina sp.]